MIESQAAFARRMRWSRSRVTQLKRAGRLVMAGKRVDVEASKKRIKETESGQPQHATHRSRLEEKRNRGKAANQSQADLGGEGTEQTQGEGGGYTPDARAYWERREAAARAQTREIELRKLKGKLVEIVDVRDAGREAGTAVRAVLENLADQLAPVLAVETDEPQVHRLLREQMDQVLVDIIARIGKATEALTEDKAA